MINKNLVLFSIVFFAISFSIATPILAQDQPAPTEPAPAPAPTPEPTPVPEPPKEEPAPSEPAPTEPAQPTEPPKTDDQPKPTEPLPPPPIEVPKGCRSEVDSATGSTRTICEDFGQQTCPLMVPGEESRCSDEGGRPNYFADAAGCKAFRCEFQQRHEDDGGFFSKQTCAPEEEQKASFEKCNKIGGRSFVRNEQGCNIVECATGERPQRRGPECPQRSPQDYQREGMACGQKGGRIVSNFDDNGCNIQKCIIEGERGEGEFRGPPKRAFEDCNAKGGEMITQQDDEGRVVFARCVAPGDERDIDYQEIREVPPATKLLSLALQLENVKIEFDKLVTQTSDIAKYYESSGDQASADRFSKAASMFESAKAKIDEIKNKMRDRLKGITREDVSEILHDIKYVREVMMEDILYVMLSTDGAAVIEERAIEEIRTTTKAEIKDGVIQCGDNGMCFDKAIRTCSPASFNPPDDLGGADSIDIEIKGIEGTACVFTGKVIVNAVGVVADMTCKYPKYTFGLRGPEDIMPYCEGSMKDGFERSQREGRTPTRRGPPPGEFDDRGGFDDRRGEFDDRRTSTRNVREDFPEEEFPASVPTSTARIVWP